MNLLNSLRKRDKCSTSLAFYLFSPTRLINSIKHEHSCKILYCYSFSNITNKHGDVFLWNPCNSFSYPKGNTTSTCGNVAVCMRLPFASPETMYSLGTQNTATFTQDQGGVHISYASTQGGHNYVANILLRCNHTLQNSFLDADTYQPYVTNTSSIYNLILNSKHACSYSPSSSGSSTIMSTSSSSTSSSSPSSSGSSTIMSTSSSYTPKTSSPGSYQTSTAPSETSETSPVSTDSTRKSSTPVHTTTSPSGSAAMPLRRLNSFVLLCFTLHTFNLV